MNTGNGDMLLDCRIKTRDGWVAGVDFFHKRLGEKAHVLKEKYEEKLSA